MKKPKLVHWRWLLAVVMAAISVAWLVPFALVIGASVKTPDQFSRDGYLGLSGSVTALIDNSMHAAELASVGPALLNSAIYSTLGAAFAVLFSAMAAYGLVWLKLRFPFLLFMIIYTGTLVPFQMYIVPLNAFTKWFHLYDSRSGMLLIYTTLCVPFCVFVMRAAFMGIPAEIVEAAKMDGAGPLAVFGRIILPSAVPPMVFLYLTQFTWIWNDLLFGQVLTTSSQSRPVMPAVAQLAGNLGLGTVPERMAIALVASVPTLALFLLLRRRFMEGFSLHGR